MNQREATRIAHGMVYQVIDNLLTNCEREDLPPDDVVRIDRALDRMAQSHFELSNLIERTPISLSGSGGEA